MMGNSVVYPFHIPGTLAANIAIKFKAPADMSLKHISVQASNDSDATLKVGNSDDDDAYVAATTIGDSGTPKEIGQSGFVGTQFPHISKGTIFTCDIDYDGSSGTAAANVTAVFTFSEG